MDLAGVLLHVWGLAVGKAKWIQRALLGLGRVGIGEDEQVHKKEFFEAEDFRLAAGLAGVAARVWLDAADGFLAAGKTEADIVVKDGAVFAFGENGFELSNAGFGDVGFTGHKMDLLYWLNWVCEVCCTGARGAGTSQGRSEAECSSALAAS
jgi:hypothetical protein